MSSTGQIAEAVGALRRVSASRFRWLGSSTPDFAEAARATDEAEVRRRLLRNLQSCLYGHFYCRGGASPLVGDDFSADLKPDPDYISCLMHAYQGRGQRQDGWDVVEIREGWARLRQRRMQVVARIGTQCEIESEPAPGGHRQASVWFPSSLVAVSPGFYMVQSEQPLAPEARCLRLYMNVTPSGGEELFRQVPGVLNDIGIGYRIKCLNNPRSFHRCDAAVLYIDGVTAEGVNRAVDACLTALEPYLKPRVPALTLRLAPGLGAAWDPGAEESFGESRCRLLSEAIVDGWDEGESGTALVNRVALRFERDGIDIGRPYRRTTDPQLEQLIRVPSSSVTTGFRGEPSNKCPPSPVEIATSIGAHLLETACWIGRDECTWIGGTAGPGGKGIIGADLVYEPLSADIYGGTAGIAFFLGELFRVTRENRFADGARAAMRCSYRAAGSIPPERSFSLYSGRVGLALVADRLGRLLDDRDLLTQAARTIASLTLDDLTPANPDILNGLSGGVIGLFSLAAGGSSQRCAALANASADRIVDSSVRRRTGRVWRHEKPLRQPTGFSLGAAGIAHALIEAWKITGNRRYTDAACEAIEYEQSTFDAEERNWPDYRPDSSGKRAIVRPHGLSWCQGAPGIAVSRLAAWLSLGDDAFAAQALIALRTTCSIVDVWLASGGGNFSLCHGLAGNAEILGMAGTAFPHAEAPEWLTRLKRTADFGAETYALRAGSWPSGVGGEGSPALMVGLAGTGLFYLRLHDSSVPSWLAPAVKGLSHELTRINTNQTNSSSLAG